VLKLAGQRRDLTRPPNLRRRRVRDEHPGRASVSETRRREGGGVRPKTAGSFGGKHVFQPRTGAECRLRARTRVRRVAFSKCGPQPSITLDDRSRHRCAGRGSRNDDPGITRHVLASDHPGRRRAMKRTSARRSNRRGTRIQPHANGLVTGHHTHLEAARAQRSFQFTTHRRRAEQQHRTARDVRSEASGPIPSPRTCTRIPRATSASDVVGPTTKSSHVGCRRVKR